MGRKEKEIKIKNLKQKNTIVPENGKLKKKFDSFSYFFFGE